MLGLTPRVVSGLRPADDCPRRRLTNNGRLQVIEAKRDLLLEQRYKVNVGVLLGEVRQRGHTARGGACKVNVGVRLGEVRISYKVNMGVLLGE
eukprot:806201-Prorocentrum_minimum.AAC.1